ncbi:undecaprenyl-diphosphate phosphatase [Verrucomicrobia bacterium]|nr:undecaprenyl-diphosphate phosphatase [Verrucomicrobiota bacterium]
MPDWLQVILLGVVEGITEFLPVSSTGHLLLAEPWLGARPDHFTICIQSGAVLAVLAVFRERVRSLWEKRNEVETQDYLKKLGFSFVLTGIGGLTLKAAGWELPNTIAPIGWALLIGGLFFIAHELRQSKKKESNAEENKPLSLTWTIAIAFGLAQLVAMVFPGASRSGATIFVGLILGMARRDAVEFSFLLGVPTLLAAGGYEIASALKENTNAVISELDSLLIGTAASAVTAFIVVNWLLGYLQRNTFLVFGWYRFGVGLLVLGMAAMA